MHFRLKAGELPFQQIQTLSDQRNLLIRALRLPPRRHRLGDRLQRKAHRDASDWNENDQRPHQHPHDGGYVDGHERHLHGDLQIAWILTTRLRAARRRIRPTRG